MDTITFFGCSSLLITSSTVVLRTLAACKEKKVIHIHAYMYTSHFVYVHVNAHVLVIVGTLLLNGIWVSGCKPTLLYNWENYFIHTRVRVAICNAYACASDNVKLAYDYCKLKGCQFFHYASRWVYSCLRLCGTQLLGRPSMLL